MQIWVDADACPVKSEIERLAGRRGMTVTHVCGLDSMNRQGEGIRVVQVPGGPDAADDWILAQCEAGDLVLTDDVPLAASAIKLGAFVLEFRGRELHADNIPLRVQVRDFAAGLREQGEMTSGPPPFSAKDRKAFTSALARILDRDPGGGIRP